MNNRARLLTIMGSGETAPTMTKVHRAVLERLEAPVAAVLLDTPYGFQENADDISARAGAYFARNLGVRVEVARWRGAAVEPLERERALARVRAADYVFAGPGSPSYALSVWRGSPLREVLAAKLHRGGCLTFASAAAVTLGVAALPVYEIYKVGAAPHWLEGLDLLGEIGLRAAVIPHYDNAEGGTHDTRYCYLGERRLRLLEPELPADTVVLGVDEHTACLLDLDAGTATVLGRGGVTIRRQGASTVFPSGSVLSLGELTTTRPAAAAAPFAAGSAGIPSLRGEAARLEQAFEEALARRDVAAGVAAALELEQVLSDWAADTEAGDLDLARSALRGMLVRLGEAAAAGMRDLREPLVEVLVELRDEARAERAWGTADRVRDRLSAAGVELRDTPAGTEWLFRDGSAR